MDRTAESPTNWDALFDALLDDADSVSTRIRARLQAEFAGYRTISGEPL